VIGSNLSIDKDGLTYCIEYTSVVSHRTVEALLREDEEGWQLTDCTHPRHKPLRDFSQGIGRRKSWIKALHDALVIVEAEAKREAAS
jgi:hypothetical protein